MGEDDKEQKKNSWSELILHCHQQYHQHYHHHHLHCHQINIIITIIFINTIIITKIIVTSINSWETEACLPTELKLGTKLYSGEEGLGRLQVWAAWSLSLSCILSLSLSLGGLQVGSTQSIFFSSLLIIILGGLKIGLVLFPFLSQWSF